MASRASSLTTDQEVGGSSRPGRVAQSPWSRRATSRSGHVGPRTFLTQEPFVGPGCSGTYGAVNDIRVPVLVTSGGFDEMTPCCSLRWCTGFPRPSGPSSS